MQLRDYQRAAVDSTWNFLRARTDNPCIVLPTGSGKTIVLAEMIRHALTEWPGTRICVLAHVRELVAQNAGKLQKYWPEAPLGIYSASLGRRDRFEPVIFAGIQSVASKAMQLGRFDMLMIDEAHRIPLRAEGQYRQFIDGCRAVNPALRIAGLTATPYRLGGGPVCGSNYILNEVCYEARVSDLIHDGYLSRLVSKAGIARANMTGVHVRGGEYVASEIDTASNVPAIVAAACDEIVTLCANRHAWLVFAAGVKHAEAVTAALTTRGVPCRLITGATPSTERDESISLFQRGALRALVNVNVLSEGFDATHIDAVVMMRPTKSAALYYQQAGRGMRLHPGKQNCLVLDFAGNIAEHGPVDAIRPPKKPGQKAASEAPVRECPQCQAFVPVQVRECPECHYKFPPPDARPAHDATASDLAILSDELIPPVAFPVHSVMYARHEKPGKPPSLRVTYQSGIRFFREWICLEHGGMPRARAMTWWMRRDRSGLTPRGVDDALAVTGRLRTPAQILVREHTKFAEILDYYFDENANDESRAA